MAIVINTETSGSFSLNGTNYNKIFQPLAMGSGSVGIYNTFDTQFQLLSSTPYDEITINGSSYESRDLVVQALLPVIYETPEGGGGGGGEWGTIIGNLSNQTDVQAALDAKALKTITIGTGTGLTGGGNLTANRTLALDTSYTDGRYTRQSGTETISGTWTFSSRPAFNGGTSGASSPFTVDSTQVVSNLNADLLDGVHGSSFVRSDTSDTISGTLTYTGRPAFNSSGAPFTVNSSTVVSSLNADTVDGIHGSSFVRSDANDTKTGYLRMNDSQELQFGSSADSHIFHNGSNTYWDLVTGNFYIRDGSTTRFTFARTSGAFTSNGNVTATSDIRLKKNIQTIDNSLNKVVQLRGCTWDRKDSGERQTGLIAQELQKVLPEAVVVGEDENKTLSIAYGNVVGLLVEAIKELKQEIEELKKG